MGTKLPLGGGIARRSGFPINTFLGLTDTPNSFTGKALNLPQVNAGETALEFIPGRGQVNGVASLDATGKVPASELPALAISDFLGIAANQAAMLAFVGQEGDWCVRSDTGTTWIVKAQPSSILANWQEIYYPAHSFGGASHTADSIANVQTKLSSGKFITTDPSEIITIAENTTPAYNDYLLTEENIGGAKKKIKTSSLWNQNIYIGADQFLNPNNADWPVSNLAPLDVDSLNNAMPIRKFDDTLEQGIGFFVHVPITSYTNYYLDIIYRAQTAPGAPVAAVLKVYTRRVNINVAMGAWSAGTLLAPLSIPANAFWQSPATATLSFAGFNLSSGQTTQFCITRVGTDAGDTLVGNLNVLEMYLRLVTV
jgi:hypothetical protein